MPAIEYHVVAGEKPDMLLNYEEVKREISSPELYNFVMMYETGRCTWQQAMQGAALRLARETIRQRAEIVRLVSHVLPQPMTAHNEKIEATANGERQNGIEQ